MSDDRRRSEDSGEARQDGFARVAAELERMGVAYEETPWWRLRRRADLRSGMRQLKATGVYFIGPGEDG